ncbi:MAG TPA: FecR domain-containing protein [Lacunisphaera sp.]
MNAARHRQREQIEQQAALWSARLTTGSLSDAERLELARWLGVDPENRRVLARYRELCGQLDEQLPALLDPAETEELIAQTATRARWRRGAWTLGAVAATVVMAGLTWWLTPQTVETLPAERRSLALADGSRVDLNARSKLQIDLGRRERRVRLSQGEGFFHVAHDSSRPFFVETPQGEIRVTGTIFNVRQTMDAAVEVTVLEGAVQVRARQSPADPVPLRPTEQARLSGREVTVQTLTPEAMQAAVTWRTGQAAFEAAPLGEALERFAAYTGRDIIVSPEARKLRVGGRYSLDDTDGFLAAIQQALPVSVLRGENGSVRVVMRSRPGS